MAELPKDVLTAYSGNTDFAAKENKTEQVFGNRTSVRQPNKCSATEQVFGNRTSVRLWSGFFI